MKVSPVDLRALLEALRRDPETARALAGVLAPHVFATAINATTRPAEWSSRKGCSPPGYALKAWRELAPRIGVKRGRWFYVSAEALDAYEHAPTPASPEPERDRYDPLDAIRATGLRIVGRK